MFYLPSFFSSSVCGKRYKNRPGLSYHYAHTHLASEEGDEAQDQETRSPPNHRNENHRREFSCWVGAVMKRVGLAGGTTPLRSAGGSGWLASRACGDSVLSSQPQLPLCVGQAPSAV